LFTRPWPTNSVWHHNALEELEIAIRRNYKKPSKVLDFSDISWLIITRSKSFIASHTHSLFGIFMKYSLWRFHTLRTCMIAIKKTTPSRFYHKFFLYRQNITSFYTDGSKSQNGAVRVYVFSPEMKGSIGHKLSPKTLIFFAELWPIRPSLRLGISVSNAMSSFPILRVYWRRYRIR